MRKVTVNAMDCLRRDPEAATRLDVTVSHAWRIECGSRTPFGAVEKQPAVGACAERELAYAGVRSGLRQRKRLIIFFAMRNQDAMVVKQIGRQLGHHDFHDALAMPGAGPPPRLRISVAAAADQRGVADTPRQFAAGTPSRRCGKQTALAVQGDRTDGP